MTPLTSPRDQFGKKTTKGAGFTQRGLLSKLVALEAPDFSELNAVELLVIGQASNVCADLFIPLFLSACFRVDLNYLVDSDVCHRILLLFGYVLFWCLDRCSTAANYLVLARGRCSW